MSVTNSVGKSLNPSQSLSSSMKCTNSSCPAEDTKSYCEAHGQVKHMSEGYFLYCRAESVIGWERGYYILNLPQYLEWESAKL